MTYNHKKSITKIAESSPQNKEGSLEAYNKKWKNILPESIPNYNGLLSESRGSSEPDQTIEALMNKTRKEASDADGRTTEGQMDKRESYQVHRDSEHNDKSPMPPINALSGTYDAKFQEAYGKKSKSVARKYLDKNPGSQMDGPVTKVPANMPESGSQINNNPSRFLDSKNSEASDALIVADRSLFEIYYKAASENRDLTLSEKKIESKIIDDKKIILANLGQPVIPGTNPQQDLGGLPPQSTPGDVHLEDPSNPHHPHGSVHSEFYPQSMPGENTAADPLGENQNESDIDDDLINQLLNGVHGGTPPGGIGGEDINNPHYKNIHMQEQQDIQNDPLEEIAFDTNGDDELGERSRF